MAKPNPALAEDLRGAAPPTETLYKVAQLDSAMVDGWKERLDGGLPVTWLITPEQPTSTSRDSTVALMYAEHGEKASQKVGKENPALGVTEPTDVLPDDRPIAHYEELVPARKGGEIADKMKEADGEHIQHLARLRDVIGDEGHPATPNTDRARIDNLGEVLISGEYQLVGLLDTRPDHDYEHGDVGVVRVPGGGPTPPGVYPVYRPMTTDTGA